MTRAEKQELANSLTHGIALLGSLIGVVILLSRAVGTGSRTAVAATAVYSFSLLLVYLSSTLYHSMVHAGVKDALRRLDHVAIYFLIAGSYTPFVLLYLPPGQGHPFLIALWGLSLLGIIYKVAWLDRLPRLALAFYIGLGWMAVLVIRPLIAAMPDLTLWGVVAGGLCYTVGVLFYSWKRFTYHHAIWHLFVIGGSTCHFFAILYGVGKMVPAAG